MRDAEPVKAKDYEIDEVKDLSDFFREKYLKPHFVNVSWEGEL